MKKTNRSSHDELNLTNYLAMKNILYCLNNTVKCHFPLLCWCSLKILIGTLIPILTTILPKIVIEMITAKQSVYKLASAIQSLNNMFEKYVNIATEGNQTISPTLLAFIGEIKGLYIEAVKIEYEYYVKREKAKEEQARLKEQMRQEAEERKILEAQKQQIIKEEGKYKTEIENISTQIQSSVDDEQAQLLKKRLAELEAQLAKVNDQKEEIINLQNGKAGYVYIISNLGSFGDKMFKIGMTRRINPQDRVDELGDASVPFKFDVHSFIFSEDAVSLEGALHKRLEKQRVNKINLRKEFFYSNIDELETLVNEIDPTAEFNRTMLAEQYKQSLTISENE